ncbi:MAG: C40 family peptidase [Clostridiales bacterium]|nr:C40 family peptidase [Clostridiales bacterium]
MGMELFRNYRLVEDSQGFVLEIYLNKDDEEFSAEFLAKIKENALGLEESVKKLIAEKFPNIKINAVKFLIGSMVVGSLALGGLSAHQNMTASAAAPQASAVQMANQRTATVTASQLNVRSGPSTAYSIVHVLRQGETVEVIGESDGWYQIRLKDGRVGWSSGQYLNLNSQSVARQAKVDAVLNRAKSFLGTPYVWGGASPSDGGFDCSGFTQYVFAQSGYNLNRVSKDQALNGTYVPRGSTQPGDLVFYSHAQNGVIDHVGIYLGDGKMIHSPKTGDVVRIADVTTDYWTSRYVTTRRIIP